LKNSSKPSLSIISVFCLTLIVLALIFESPRAILRGMHEIIIAPDILLTDYIEVGGIGAAFFNAGLMGLICIGFVIVCNGIFNGPVIAGILTVVGFSAYGKHPKNSIPILLGIILASAIKIWDTSSTVVIIAGLFGTTLAPIAGQFGWIAGIIAGCLHLSISMNVGIIHGGINLYNNGFAGGMVAGIIVPILKAFKENKLADC